MGDMNELTVIVFRKAGSTGHVANGEAFRLIQSLLESNGLEVGEPIDLADGFLFSIRPRTEAWNDTERCAVMTGLSCLGPFGFSGYIAQRVLEDEVRIDGGTVALGLAALVATATLAIGGVIVGAKGIRAVGKRLFAR